MRNKNQRSKKSKTRKGRKYNRKSRKQTGGVKPFNEITDIYSNVSYLMDKGLKMFTIPPQPPTLKGGSNPLPHIQFNQYERPLPKLKN
jgi:hypothetical protein